MHVHIRNVQSFVKRNYDLIANILLLDFDLKKIMMFKNVVCYTLMVSLHGVYVDVE